MLVCRMCGSALWSFVYELVREDVLGRSLYQYASEKQCECSHVAETKGEQYPLVEFHVGQARTENETEVHFLQLVHRGKHEQLPWQNLLWTRV